MSQYSVEEVSRRKDLDSIVDVIWAAMDGFDPSHQIFFPVLGTKPIDRDTAIQSSKDRTWEDHKGDPSSHWIFVREKASGLILGGCQWRIYTKNPFPNGTPHIEATWWPEGEGRRFATEVVRQCYTPRTKWMAYPHVGKLPRILNVSRKPLTALSGLSLMCVYPQFQRRGIGHLLMAWGLVKIDSLGLESFIEATDSGKGLYAKCGFRPVKVVTVDMSHPDWNEEWASLSAKFAPISYTAMWRPSKGEWKDGEPDITWTKRLKATCD